MSPRPERAPGAPLGRPLASRVRDWFGARRDRREALIVRLYGLVTLLIGLTVATFGQTVLDRLTVLVFDAYQRMQPRIEAGAPVVLVDIDEASLGALGQWPWPRTVIASIVDRLGAYGAATIAFDMVFPEPDRTSLARIVADLGEAGAAIALPKDLSLIDNDRLLAAAFARNRVTAGLAISNETAGALPPPKAGFAFGGEDPKLYLERFRGGVTNLALLDGAATGLGFFSFPPSADGIVREVPIISSAQGQLYPALAVEALRVAQGASSLIVRSTGASGELDLGASAMTAVKIGDVEVPTTSNGSFWIYFSDLPSMPTISARALLDTALETELSEAIAGKIVIVGTSAVGLRDLVATPVAASMPGMRVHAEILDQILGGTYLTRPDWAKGAETVVALVFGVIMILMAPRTGALVSAVGTVGFVVVALALSWFAFSEGRLLLDPILPAVSVASVFAVTMPVLLLLTNREKKFVRGAFGRYLSPTLVERLADDPAALKLGGELRDLTVLFSDIRGFTSLSEKLDPHALTTLLNGFLTPMTDVLLRSDATIDKYMGDAIMAFWNAPLDIADHRRVACKAALEMVAGLKALNEAGDTELKIGIGLNFGLCCVGNLGSAQRFSYSAIGDGVNVASRIEGLTKAYGLSIIVSDNVQSGAEGLAFLAVDLVRVVGRRVPLPIFALIGDEAESANPAFEVWQTAHEAMIAAYRAARFDEAARKLKLAEALDTRGRLASVYTIYADRLAAFETNPPGPDWDGVFEAREK